MLYTTNFYLAKDNLVEYSHVNDAFKLNEVLNNFEQKEDKIFLIEENGMHSIICVADTNMCVDTEDVIPGHMQEKYEILKLTKTDFNPVMTTIDIKFDEIMTNFMFVKQINNTKIYECIDDNVIAWLNNKIQNLTVLDGHHRLNAIRKCGFEKIMVSITPKTELKFSLWVPVITASFSEFEIYTQRFCGINDVLQLKFTDGDKFGVIPIPKSKYFDTIKRIINRYKKVEYCTKDEAISKLSKNTISIGFDEDIYDLDFLLSQKLPRKTTNFVKYTSGIIAYKR